MTISNEQLQQLRVAFEVWRSQEEIAGRPFPEASAFDAITADAVRYGALQGTRSAFARAVFEAAKAGKIRLLPPTPVPPEIDDAFRAEIQRMPSSDLLKRINRDPEFRAKFDALSLESSTAHQSDPDDYSSFQAADWRSVPAATLVRLMTKPGFRRRIEELAAAGQI